MKYKNENVIVPQEQREEINQKLLYVIENSLNVVTQEDVYNAYSGIGGLHGLEYNDFNSYYEYGEAKKSKEQGQFFTPHKICEFIVNCIKPSKDDHIADITAGIGNFANWLPAESNIYLNELEMKAYKVMRYLYPSANLNNDDMRNYNPNVKMDIVFGNPPFNLKMRVGKDEYISQLYYCIKANEILKQGGILALIIPNSFLSDTFSDGGMIKAMNEMYNFICQFNLPVDSFKGVGVDKFETKVMIFQKRSEHIEYTPYTTDKIEIGGVTEETSNYIYDTYIRPITERKEQLKAKLFVEQIRNTNTKENSDFEYQIKKLAYDIKRNSKTNINYNKCMDYLEKFHNQKQPEGMKYEDWEKIKITPKKVISYFKKQLAKQNQIEIDKIELVKTNYTLKLKAYSHKTKLQLSKIDTVKEMSINNIVLNNDYRFDNKKYLSLCNSKVKKYQKQNQSFKNMNEDKSIRKWLNKVVLMDNINNKELRLNEKQKEDLNKVFQKRYSILNWEMGSGKTVASIIWSKYLFETTNIRNIFVVAPALAISLTWSITLKNYNENYIYIKSLKDIKNIQQNQIVIISFEMLNKYQKQIKKYIKLQSQKVGIVIDEADETCNHLAKRTRAVLSCFRKCRYKLLTTGTTTRNNVNELYSLFETLYNNSINMLNKCEYKYKYDKKENIVVTETNESYNKPFAAYYGNNVFKQCFSPNKTTVFGVKQENQDIYNIEHLTELIEKTIITRKLEDIAGKKLSNIHTVTAIQNESERQIYKVILEEFYEMQHYFASSGNYRKDAMLKIIKQIQLLIKSTSIPNHFKEYDHTQGLPNKFHKIFELVEQFENEKVAIGTVFIDTAEDYYNQIQQRYNRPVFLIKGEVSYKKRNEIIEEFEASLNGILISTQQSLKSSVNIPSCNKVIIESNQWNLPKIKQYYYRFIRMTSEYVTDVYFVTYDYTIEQNILALLMSKERINEFVRTLEFKEQSEIYDEYDIDLSILNNVIEKEKQKDGSIKFKWGEQKVS